MGLFWKGKVHLIAEIYETDLDILGHIREKETLFYSQINAVQKQSAVLGSALLQIIRGNRDNLGIIFLLLKL